MDILVIGNGFDLAHDLKTSYKNFLEYCSKKDLKDCTESLSICKRLCKNNLWMKHFITRQNELGDTWIDLENEIFNVIWELKELEVAGASGVLANKCPQLLYMQEDLTISNLAK